MKKRLLAITFAVAAGTTAGHLAAQSVMLSQDFEGTDFPPEGWSVLDADGDGKSWIGYSGSMAKQAPGSSKLAISFARDPENYSTVYGAQDNWLISPEFEVTNNAFVLAFNYAAQDMEKSEKMEILVSEGGTSPSDFTQLHKDSYVDNGYEDDIVIQSLQKSLKDYEGKKIRIAFRHEANASFGLSVDNIFIYNQRGPVKPTGFTVKAGENAALEAILSWTNPAKAANGDAIEGLEILIYRDGELLTTLSEGMTPGESATYTDKEVTNGNHTYTIAAKSIEGTGQRLAAKKIYVGEDAPAAVGTPLAMAVDSRIVLTWAAPTKGANNGQVNLDNLTYTITRTAAGDKTSFRDIRGLAWTDETAPAGKLCVYSVQAVNVAGTSPVADHTAAVVFDEEISDMGCFQTPERNNRLDRIPISLNDKYSVSQSIYYPSDLQYAQGNIEKLVYKVYRGTSGQSDIPVKIYLHETDATSITDKWLPVDEAQLVFDGTFDFSQGTRDVVFDLTEPFTYNGGNLVVTFIKTNAPNGSYSDRFHSIDTPVADRTSVGSAYSEVTIGNLASVSASKSSQMPSTRFIMTAKNMGTLSGVVSDEATGQPLAGATVSVEGYDALSTITKTDGAYKFRNFPAGDITMKVTANGYMDATTAVSLTAGEQGIKNVALSRMANYTLKGRITCGDTGLPADGARITLTGYAEASAIADGNGAFSIAGVYSAQDYTIAIEYPLYDRYATPVNNVSEGEVAMPEVALDRSLISPFAVQTSTADDASCVNITWSDPLSRDVEPGWRSVNDVSVKDSESGDYSLTDYNVGHLFTAADLAAQKATGASVKEIKAYIKSAKGQFEARVWRVVDGNRVPVACQEIPASDISADGAWVQVTFDEPAEIKDGFDYIFGLKVKNADKYPVGTAPSKENKSGYNNLKWSDNPDDYCYNGYYPWCIMAMCGIPGTDSPLAENPDAPKPSFNVYRKAGEAGEWAKVNASPLSETAYADDAWPALVSDTYTYGVTAVYADGESAKALSEPLSRSNDFDAAVTAFVSPVKSVDMQSQVTVKVTVTNLGEKQISAIPVKLYLDGEFIGTSEVATMLNKGDSFDVEFTPTEIEEGVHTFKAETDFADDEVAANNALTFTLPNLKNVEMLGYRWDAYGYAGMMRVQTNNPEAADYMLEMTPNDALVIAAERAQGKIYAFTATWYGASREFVVIDPVTWTVERSIENTDDYILDMAYDHRHGTLYGLKPDGENVQLVTIDIENGIALPVGNTGKVMRTLACGLESKLYAISEDGGFYTLDATTGAATLTGMTGIDKVVFLQSMGFDHRSGRLFWAHTSDNVNGDLYEIDPETGIATRLGGVLKDGNDPTEIVGLHSAYDPVFDSIEPTHVSTSFTLGYDGHTNLLVNSATDTNIEVYNTAGIKVMSTSVAAGRNALPVNISAGVYMAKATDATGVTRSLKIAVK